MEEKEEEEEEEGLDPAGEQQRKRMQFAHEGSTRPFVVVANGLDDSEEKDCSCCNPHAL